MLPTSIERARYQEDIEVLEGMRADDLLQRAMQKSELFKRRSAIRVKLLASAVRVQVELLPNVGRSFERLSALVPGDKPLEAYVFSDPQINAFLIDGGRSRYHRHQQHRGGPALRRGARVCHRPRAWTRGLRAPRCGR